MKKASLFIVIACFVITYTSYASQILNKSSQRNNQPTPQLASRVTSSDNRTAKNNNTATFKPDTSYYQGFPRSYYHNLATRQGNSSLYNSKVNWSEKY